MALWCSAVLLGALRAPDALAGSDPAYDISISARPVREAIVALALQTDISVGGVDPARCGTVSRAVSGRMTAEQALHQLLPPGPCTVRRFGAHDYRLELRAPPPVRTRSAPRSAPPSEPPRATVVVVTRRPVDVNATPRPVSVVPGAVLSGNDLDLNSLAVRVPGMVVTNLGPGRDKILLRGVSDSVLTGRTQSTVGLYLDDAPITYNAPDPDLLLVDMARVEVLKGPQGALYGLGSLSGVVRLVTQRPRLDSFEGEIAGGVGVTHGGQTSWRVSGMLNLPLVPHRAALRAVFYDDRSGGFIRNPGTGANPTNTTLRSGGRVALAIQPDDRTTISLTAVVQRLKSENSQYVLGRTHPFKRDVALAEPHDNNFAEISATVERRMAGGTFQLAVNHLHHALYTGYDAQPLQRYVSVPNSGVLFYTEDQRIALTTAEATFLSPAEQRVRWLTGLFWAQSHEDFSPHLADVYTNRLLYNEVRKDRIGDLAVFGALSYDLSPKWTASLGLRARQSQETTQSRIDNVHLTGFRPNGSLSGRLQPVNISHSLLLTWRPTEDMTLYAQNADGFRTGGFNTTTQITAAGPLLYKGDTLDNYELGMKYRAPDHRLRFSLAAFRIDWRNIQSDQLRTTGLPMVATIGDGINTGAELEADWTTLGGVDLHFAGQVNDPRLVRPNPQFSMDKGKGMPFIARHSFSLSADWHQDWCSLRFDNSLTLSERGASPLNYGKLRDIAMDPYVNLDMATFVTVYAYRMGVRLTNVTGVGSNSFAYGNPFSLEGARQITPVRPRTMWVSVSRHF